jgi:hypothetical protein
VKRVVAQFDSYCHVVTVLPHESIRLVADILESEPSETPYDDIKQRLVASHQLSDFQKVERLFQMPALGGRKPSELMAAMQENLKTDFVAAISGDRHHGGGAARGKTCGGGRGRGGKAAPRLPEPEASKEARLATGLCIKHWRYREAASSCEQPCSWQGNGGAGSI